MKILRQVFCSDRLPDKIGTYHCKRNTESNEISLYFDPSKLHHVSKFNNVAYWYEEIDLKLKSAQILPLDKRVGDIYPNNPEFMSETNNIIWLRKYEEALEAAELETAELKAKYVNEHNLVTQLIKDKAVIDRLTLDDLKVIKPYKTKANKPTKFNSIGDYIKALEVGSFIYPENAIQACDLFIGCDVIESHLSHLAETTNLVKKVYRLRCTYCAELDDMCFAETKEEVEEHEVCEHCGKEFVYKGNIETWYKKI